MPNLERYRQKRDFEKTPEPPPGDADARARNLVFVVQQHAAYRAGMHWDFRLEAGGVLKSWPLRKAPSLDPKEKRGATMVEDHPYDYRTFEGVIAKGQYGGGQVIVWDEGIYTPDEDGVASWNDKEEGSRRMLEGISAGKVSFVLQGSKLRGSFALVKTKYRPDSWLLIKHKDGHVSERDLSQDSRSVRSGLTVQDLKEGRLPPPPPAESAPLHASAKKAPMPSPAKERPMLATLLEEAFDAPGWLWEPKLDGIRVLAFVSDGKVELRSRRGVDVTRAYPSLVAALKAQPVESMVLDGEICALDENGAPRFQLIQPRINLTRQADIARAEAEVPVVLYAFDLIYLDGHDLKAVPLRERKAALGARLRAADPLRLVSAIADHGRDLAASVRHYGLEGVVGKRAESRYEPGARSRSWVKVKAVQEQEFVVGGFKPGEGGRRSTFGSLAIGYYDDGKLHYAGHVGSGFDGRTLDAVLAKLRELETDRSPFAGKVDVPTHWVEPKLVAAVKFAEWTHDGRLRAPVFLGLRGDIEASQVRRERAVSLEVIAADAAPVAAPQSQHARVLAQLENPKAGFVIDVEGAQVKLTNLDKEFWPAYGEAPAHTKRDLIRFYVELAPVLLPHLKDRPLTLTRYPNGIHGSLFYQKHYAQPLPDFVETTLIWSGVNEQDGTYLLCNNQPTLIWLAQLADIELHAWMSRLDPEPDAPERPLRAAGAEETIDASVLSFPDYLIFDLDPYIYSGEEVKGAEPEYNRRGWEKTVEVALVLKDMLDGMRLSSYIKTSGKTGLHVYVPIQRSFHYDEVRAFAQTVGRFLAQQRPKDVTMEWDTSKRRGKVFFDANQNTRGKTLAAQYSLRPTPWAGVSTPIAWSELTSIDPMSLNIASVTGRVAQKGDLWADILQRKNDLRAVLAATA